jgi:superfamily II DNA helicase RecQ
VGSGTSGAGRDDRPAKWSRPRTGGVELGEVQIIILFTLRIQMQIKFFTIPIVGGEALIEDLNVFLRSKKILQIDQQLVQGSGSALWCFSIRYIDTAVKEKTDYRAVLEPVVFERFSKLRAVRKRLAEQEGIPAYSVFTDEELAALAKFEVLTSTNMKSVEGIGEKKLQKFGHFFISEQSNETRQ